ncbi:MAG: hypothetical protein AMS26_15045 [Bacteroides sp. SM23_62]|nr:MAG: hypothetical protein AMS26_15045 [Bacteroides sp. SM23_62]
MFGVKNKNEDEVYRGMLVWVYRSDYRGMDTQVSNIWDRLLLTGEYVAEVFEETDPTKVVKLVRREIGGREYLHAEPVITPNVQFVRNIHVITRRVARRPINAPLIDTISANTQPPQTIIHNGVIQKFSSPNAAIIPIILQMIGTYQTLLGYSLHIKKQAMTITIAKLR